MMTNTQTKTNVLCFYLYPFQFCRVSILHRFSRILVSIWLVSILWIFWAWSCITCTCVVYPTMLPSCLFGAYCLRVILFHKIKNCHISPAIGKVYLHLFLFCFLLSIVCLFVCLFGFFFCCFCWLNIVLLCSRYQWYQIIALVKW